MASDESGEVSSGLMYRLKITYRKRVVWAFCVGFTRVWKQNTEVKAKTEAREFKLQSSRAETAAGEQENRRMTWKWKMGWDDFD